MGRFIIEQNTLRLRSWEQYCPGLVAGFTLRSGGHSTAPYHSLNLGLHVGDSPERVRLNREQLCRTLGFPFAAWTCAEQVHGTAVRQVTWETRGAGREQLATALKAVDGLHTNEAGILLTSFYADCVPLYFLDPQRGVIALAHAGWRGTVGRIAAVMLQALVDNYGCAPDSIWVAIGPAIGGCCYEVDERVMDEVRRLPCHWERCVQPVSAGRWKLDLAALNQLILAAVGVPASRITRSSYCTACHPELFFSHRRDAGRTGRMASFIGWRVKGDSWQS